MSSNISREAGFVIVELPVLEAGPEPDGRAFKLISRWRDLRLHALRTSREAFATLYEDERRRGSQHTFDRLTNEKSKHFVAIKQVAFTTQIERATRHDRVGQLLTEPWLGMVVLLGPYNDAVEVSATMDPFTRLAANTQSGAMVAVRELEHRFQLTGLFVDESARGQGIGRLLIDHAVKVAKKIAAAHEVRLTCNVIVDKDNVAAIKLYQTFGFQAVGEEMYEKRMMEADEVVLAQRAAIQMRLG